MPCLFFITTLEFGIWTLEFVYLFIWNLFIWNLEFGI